MQGGMEVVVVDPVGWGSATGLGRGGEGWGKDSMG